MTQTLEIRAVMLDLARVTERMDYYSSLLPWMAKWGYNTVHLHLTDDQCCALVFPRRPELATPGAFTAEEMRGFVREARSCGLDVLPEIECLGHARFITAHPRYRHLDEPGLESSGFNALCPSHPETRAILADLLRDTADIFEHPVIHVGLDEVKFGECARCRKKFGKIAPEWQRYAQHAAWVHSMTRRVGRRPAMWADHVVKVGEIQKSFEKDVLMFHWDYNPEFPLGVADVLFKGGFEVVCCPATVCWLTRMTVNAGNLSNLRTATARCASLRSQGILGVDNTIWCPWRYLPGAIDFGMAFAGHLMTGTKENPRFPEIFAKSFYGLKSRGETAAVGVALMELADVAFGNSATARVAFGSDQTGDVFSREDKRLCERAIPRVSGVVAALKRAHSGVRSHADRYDDVILTAEAVLSLARFGASDRKKRTVYGIPSLILRVLEAWDRDRRPDDANKYGDPRHHGNDSLLTILTQMI